MYKAFPFISLLSRGPGLPLKDMFVFWTCIKVSRL